MKKTLALVLLIVFVLGLTACSTANNDISKPQSDPTNNPATEVKDTVVSEPPYVQNDATYGCLQGLVETYGFPICLRMTEGMEITTIELSENSAEREWMSNNEKIVHDNLTWSIVDNHLVIDGDWEEEFTVNVESGHAVSALDGKDYKIIIYDEDGNPAFFIP